MFSQGKHGGEFLVSDFPTAQLCQKVVRDSHARCHFQGTLECLSSASLITHLLLQHTHRMMCLGVVRLQLQRMLEYFKRLSGPVHVPQSARHVDQGGDVLGIEFSRSPVASQSFIVLALGQADITLVVVCLGHGRLQGQGALYRTEGRFALFVFIQGRGQIAPALGKLTIQLQGTLINPDGFPGLAHFAQHIAQVVVDHGLPGVLPDGLPKVLHSKFELALVLVGQRDIGMCLGLTMLELQCA